MKIFHLLLSGLFLLAFSQCKNKDAEIPNNLCEENSLSTFMIDYEEGIELTFPSCFQVIYLAGEDSLYGKIEAPDEEIEIFFDIGDLAGEYVDSDTPDMTTVQGDFEVFRYAVRNGNELRFTFPSAGPTNFYTRQIEHQDDLVEFFKTLKFN